MKNFAKIAFVAASMMLGAFAAPAMAATYNFNNIEGGSTAGDALVANFTLEVTDLGNNQVMMEITSFATNLTFWYRDISLNGVPWW